MDCSTRAGRVHPGCPLLANRFWQAPADTRPMMANAFFEHLGLVGGFLLVALQDWISRREADVHTWTGQ